MPVVYRVLEDKAAAASKPVCGGPAKILEIS